MAKTYFVDFFNTTVFRKKSEQDVFFDFAVLMGKKHSIEPAAIYNLLLKHKRNLAIEKWKKTREAEYYFDEIIDRVAKDLFFNCDNDGGFCNDASSLYFEAELQQFILNDKLISFLREEKAKGAKLYVVSQFYCGSDVLKGWLSALGADEIFDEVFVSCELCKSKRRGTIYKYLLKELNLDKKNVTMIGDNRHSDYTMAKRNGLNAVLRKHKEPNVSKNLKLKKKYGANYCELRALMVREKGKNCNNFAFPLYLTIKRLCDDIEERGVKDIFFFAREGKLLKRLFETYRQITGKCANVKSHYFLISRNSVMTTTLAPIEEEKFPFVLRTTFMSVLSANTFLISIGFSEEQIETLQQRFKFPFKKPYLYFYATKKYRQLIEDPVFHEMYDEMRMPRKESFMAYIDSFGTSYRQDGMYIVDVGWRGRMQDMLQKTLGDGIPVHGYYLGLTDKSQKGMQTKTGLLYCKKRQKYRFNKYFGGIACFTNRYAAQTMDVRCRMKCMTESLSLFWTKHWVIKRYLINYFGRCKMI